MSYPMTAKLIKTVSLTINELIKVDEVICQSSSQIYYQLVTKTAQ